MIWSGIEMNPKRHKFDILTLTLWYAIIFTNWHVFGIGEINYQGCICTVFSISSQLKKEESHIGTGQYSSP